MPVIQRTASDKMATVVINEVGWKTAVIDSIDGPQAAASGKSISFLPMHVAVTLSIRAHVFQRDFVAGQPS